MRTHTLIADLIESTRHILSKAEELKQLSEETLNFKENDSKWSILECIEHLNLYGDFYNPAIKKSIQNSKSTAQEIFKSGVMGNYFTNSMLPKEKLNSMKTFSDKNPAGSNLNKKTLDRFIKQQKEFLDLIALSKKVDLSKTKTPITLSKFIRLRLGDTFRFNVAHNQRHFVQIDKILTIANVNLSA